MNDKHVSQDSTPELASPSLLTLAHSRGVGILHTPLQSPQWWHLHFQAAIPHQLANITVAGSKTGSPFEKIKETDTLPHLRRCRPWFPRRRYTTKYTCKGQLLCVNTENHSFCMVPTQLRRPHSPIRNEPLLKTLVQAKKPLPIYSTIFLCKPPEFSISEIFPETSGDVLTLTNVKDSLLSCVLPGMPVLPIFQLLISVFILTENNHDHTLWKTTPESH